MTRVPPALRAIFVISLLSTTASAQWTLEWYVDEDVGGPGLILNNFAVPVAADSGNYVYLIHDADGDGIDWFGPGFWDGTLMDDDTIVQDWGGPWASAEIGSVDLFLNSQGDGEVHHTSTLDETVYTGNLWAVAFDGTVNVVGPQQFSGNARYGFAAGATTLDHPFDSWDIGGFNASNLLVPEPTTVALMIAGLAGVVLYRSRRGSP